MPWIQILCIAAAALVGLSALTWLLLWINPWWIRWFDKADRHDPRTMLAKYELPRYFTRRTDGKADRGSMWKGWDLWNAVALTGNDGATPCPVIRASAATGLFGLEGIDNYERLSVRLDDRLGVAHTCLVPTPRPGPGGVAAVFNNFSQNYLPRANALIMETERLDVGVYGGRVAEDDISEAYVRVSGEWPVYEVRCQAPEHEIRVQLTLTMRRALWWTDLPFYTHLTAFGECEGKVTYERGLTPNPWTLEGAPETFAFKAPATFEHVFGRRLWGFDAVWSNTRLIGLLLGSVSPRFKPVLYHYEVLRGDFDGTPFEGGFVQARALGIELRNRGRLFVGEAPVERLEAISVKYLEADLRVDVSHPSAVPFHSRWAVEAQTTRGQLSYVATRTHPPAAASRSISLHHFTFEGTWAGQNIHGQGYGEFAEL